MSLFYVTDISQPPTPIACPKSDAASSAQLQSWPASILVFAAGGCPDDEVTVALVSDDQMEQVGILSAACPYVHRVLLSPAAGAAGVRLVASLAGVAASHDTDACRKVASPVPSATADVSMHAGLEAALPLDQTCESGSPSGPSDNTMNHSSKGPVTAISTEERTGLNDSSPATSPPTNEANGHLFVENSGASPEGVEDSSVSLEDTAGLVQDRKRPLASGPVEVTVDEEGESAVASGSIEKMEEESEACEGVQKQDHPMSASPIETRMDEESESVVASGTTQEMEDNDSDVLLASGLTELDVIQPSPAALPPGTPTTIIQSSQAEESQGAGYATEKSPSVVVTHALPAPMPLPSTTASPSVALDLPSLDFTPACAAPEFDDDSDLESEVPWPPSTQPGYEKVAPRVREMGESLFTPLADRPATRSSPRLTSSARGRKRTKGRRSGAKRPRKLDSSLVSSPGNGGDTAKTMSARWGHAACLVDDNNVLILGGEGVAKRTPRDSLVRVTLGESSNATCSDVDCEDAAGPERRTGHTAVLDPDVKVLYLYGGSKGKKWFSDVHALDLTTWKWKKVETKGVAPCRSYHSCSFFRRECLVFGGVFPNPDPEPDGSSNDLYIFSLSEENWYRPVVTGAIPAARSGHCASRIGHRLFIFGGWDYPTFFDDLFVLDLELMDFRKLLGTGSCPSPRTWHSMVVIPDNQLLVYGGYTGDGDVALADAYVLDTDSEICSWEAVAADSPLLGLPARAGHTLTAFPEAEDGSMKILVCGGGDNDGKFFTDLVVLGSNQL